MGEYPTLYIGGLEIRMAVLTLLAAIVTALALVEIASRAWSAEGRRRSIWLVAGAAALGAGLWTLAIASAVAALPGVVTQSGPLAWLAAGLAAGVAALLVTLGTLDARRWLTVVLGSFTGAALLGLHYAVVGAARWRPSVRLDPVSAGTALGLAVAATGGLVWLAMRFRGEIGAQGIWTRRIGIAAVGVGYAVLPYIATYSLLRVPRAGAGAPAGGLVPGTGPGIVLTTGTVLAVAVFTLAALSLAISLAAANRRARRRRAETEALRRSEDRFRSLAEASAQIVWTTAPDGQMVDPQPSWGEFTGQAGTEYTSWGWFGAIHPDDREATAGMWEEALANPRPVELEHRVQRHDGRYRDCIVRMVPVLEPDGAVREWVGTHTDVTDRARTQEDRDILVEAGRVLSSSLDPRETLGALAALIVPRLADCCSVETRADDGRLERILSVHADPNRAEVLRELESRYPSSPDGARGVGYVLRTEQSELIRDFTEPILREIARDEDHRRLLRELGLTSRICVPLTARGQVLGVLTLGLSGEGEQYDLRDLALAEELARRAATAIDNSRLHAQLQSAVRGRDDVLGIVSHDLRNPLHTITMCTELLLDEEIPPEIRQKQLDTVRRSAAAMERLIQDLLDVTRSETGRLAVDPKPESPVDVLQEACETMQALAAGRSIQLVCRPEAGLPPIDADRRRVLQVLSNLIGNAVKFTHEGGQVRVAARADDDDVEFTIADNGPGIEPDNLPRIFQAHWQAKNTAHLGAGLGLAICKGIVEAHGGTIWAETRPGEGSRFHFTIPRAGPGGPGERRVGGSGAEREVTVENGAA